MIAFTGRPESSDLRPLALIISLGRTWARLRQSLARFWGQYHQISAFWGCSTKECDTAGWEHNIMSHYAKTIDFDSGTLFTDVSKLYERISHYRLFEEAVAVDINLKLIYVACSLYSGPRCLTFMDAISSVFKANGT
eukprot:8348353-Pyramimonas_sp.AAC.1